MFKTNGSGSKEEAVQDITALLYDLGANGEGVEVLDGKKDFNEFDRQKEISNLTGIDYVLQQLGYITNESNSKPPSIKQGTEYVTTYRNSNSNVKIDDYGLECISRGLFLKNGHKNELENNLYEMIAQYKSNFGNNGKPSGTYSMSIKENDPTSNTLQWFAAGLLATIASDKELAVEYGIGPVAKAEVGLKKEGNSSYINFKFEPTYKN